MWADRRQIDLLQIEHPLVLVLASLERRHGVEWQIGACQPMLAVNLGLVA